MDNVGQIAQIAVTEWHPAWFILAGLLAALAWVIYKLAMAYITTMEKLIVQQAEGNELKKNLLRTLHALRASVDKALREIDR